MLLTWLGVLHSALEFGLCLSLRLDEGTCCLGEGHVVASGRQDGCVRLVFDLDCSGGQLVASRG